MMSPGESQTLYASTNDGIYRSYDLGIIWELVSRFGLGPTANGYGVAVDPLDTLHLLVATGGAAYGLLGASTDGGANWQLIQYGAYDGVTFHPSVPNRAYAWGQGWCYQSTNSGYDWDEWYIRETGFYTVVPSVDSNRIWICANCLLWTDDFGRFWQNAMASSATYLYSVIENVLTDTTIAVGAFEGAYLISDLMGEWEFLGSGNPLFGCTLLGWRGDSSTLFGTFVYGLWSYTIGQRVDQDNNISMMPNIDFFPNPFFDHFYLSAPPGKWEMSLFNILGQKVMHCELNTFHPEPAIFPQLGYLSSGTYFVVLQSQNINSMGRQQAAIIQKIK